MLAATLGLASVPAPHALRKLQQPCRALEEEARKPPAARADAPPTKMNSAERSTCLRHRRWVQTPGRRTPLRLQRALILVALLAFAFCLRGRHLLLHQLLHERG